jgi:hypothetical protein
MDNKLDNIIDTLYKTKLLFESNGQCPHTLKKLKTALADACKLSYEQEMGQPWYKYISDEQLLNEVKLRMIKT